MKRALAALALWSVLLIGLHLSAPGAGGRQINLADDEQPAIGDRFTVPAGFRVDLAVRSPDDDQSPFR